MAALAASNISFLILTFLPPVLWLFFYLREDRHPEPKTLIFLAFVGGAFSAVLALIAECALIFSLYGSCSGGLNSGLNPFIFFGIIALIEEYAKYFPVKILVLRRRDFDESVDAMVYMMTSAMGFAALENALFVSPFFFKLMESDIAAIVMTQADFWAGLEIAANRFLGANLLHALSSGLVGFFLARSFFSPRRKHFLALGIIIAAFLHTVFNYLILVKEDVNQGTFYLILFLSLMAVMVFIDFERLKKTDAEIRA